ncbi:MAG: SulP family inorganic anion transporter [Candidatus Nanopelagicales bacterium]
MNQTAVALRERMGGRNLIAGIVVGAYLVPQAMAYGELAGVGPSVGLTVAIIPLVIYPLIGRSRWLSMGPESAVALMAGATVAPIAAANDLPVATLLGVVSVLTGLILLGARLAKLGFVTDLLSKPVLVGYLTGIAVTMAVSQLGRVLGTDVDTETLVTAVRDLADGITGVNGWAVAVALGTFVVIVGFQRWLPRIPGTLVALALGVLAGYVLPVATIGEFSISVPNMELTWIPLEVLGDLVLAAGAIAVVSLTDVVVTARAFAGKDRVDANRELTALGTVDLVGGVFGGYPMSASSSRTAIARMNGATSRWYSWVVAVVLVLTAVLLAGVLSHLPQASLAGIILFAAWSLVDKAAWIALRRMRWGEVLVALACALGVVLLGILPGIGVAIALSIAELLVRLSRPHEGVLGFVPGMAGMHDVDDYPEAEQLPGLVVYRYDAPLFFANANDFFSQCEDAADTPGCRWFVLNVEANVEVDSTGLDALVQLHSELGKRGIALKLARVKNDLIGPMRRYGVADIIGEENMYATLPTVVEAFRAWELEHPAPPVVVEEPEPEDAEISRSPMDLIRNHPFARSIRPPRRQDP